MKLARSVDPALLSLDRCPGSRVIAFDNCPSVFREAPEAESLPRERRN